MQEDEHDTEGGESGPAYAYVVQTVICRECASDMGGLAPHREKGDDDGVEYADPRDERDDRRMR